MSAGNFIVSLIWQSRAGHHIDRLWLSGVTVDADALHTRVQSYMQSERDPAEVRATSLYGWKHTRPRIGRHYPRGLLNEYARSDMLPFRTLDIGDKHITADFNPPLAGIGPMVQVASQGTAGDAGDADAALAAWLANGPGMQAPLATDTDFFSGNPFIRNDQSPDAHFYARERLVDHLDEVARADIAQHYRRALQPGMEVLDLMASWNSHLPPEMPLRMTGLGMNEAELSNNQRLAKRIVHDLNSSPELPFAEATFDAALCALSIEYLINPVSVLREVGRVLKPGAPLVISFSDRWFPPKAIRLWMELHPFERLAFVAQLLHLSGKFADIQTESMQGRPAPMGDWRPRRRPHADPLFIVTGYRTPTDPEIA